MRQGAGIFGKLDGPQKADIFDAFDSARVHVAGKLCIAEHGKAFFEAELKPISTSHAIA